MTEKERKEYADDPGNWALIGRTQDGAFHEYRMNFKGTAFIKIAALEYSQDWQQTYKQHKDVFKHERRQIGLYREEYTGDAQLLVPISRTEMLADMKRREKELTV